MKLTPESIAWLLDQYSSLGPLHEDDPDSLVVPLIDAYYKQRKALEMVVRAYGEFDCPDCFSLVYSERSDRPVLPLCANNEHSAMRACVEALKDGAP